MPGASGTPPKSGAIGIPESIGGAYAFIYLFIYLSHDKDTRIIDEIIRSFRSSNNKLK
jgi:hypothetical protein